MILIKTNVIDFLFLILISVIGVFILRKYLNFYNFSTRYQWFKILMLGEWPYIHAFFKSHNVEYYIIICVEAKLFVIFIIIISYEYYQLLIKLKNA